MFRDLVNRLGGVYSPPSPFTPADNGQSNFRDNSNNKSKFKFNMGIVSSLLGLASSVGGAFFQRKAAKDSAANQLFAIDRNNAFSERMMNQQNTFSERMMDKANEYNSIGAQTARMRGAGLNPALLYGGGNINSPGVSASTPSPASGSGIPSPTAAPFDISSNLNNALVGAQIRNIDAQTNKVKSETEGQDISNAFARLYNDKQLTIADTIIRLNGSTASLTDKQKEALEPQMRQLEKNIDYLEALTNNEVIRSGVLVSEGDIKAIEASFKSKEYQAIIDNFAAQAHLSRVQARDILTTQIFRIANLKADTAQKGALSKYFNASASNEELRFSGILFDNGIKSIQFDNMNTFGKIDAGLNTCNSFLGAIQQGYDIMFRPLDSFSSLVGAIR